MTGRSTGTILIKTPDGNETSLPFEHGANLRDILLAGGFTVRSACGGNGACGQCQVHLTESGQIPFTQSERMRLSGMQLSAGARLACQINPSTDLHIQIDQPVAHMAWRPLRDDEYGEPVTYTSRKTRARYGVAIDLGTTHIRLTLWDMVAHKRIVGLAGLNPQGSYGADVLTRLMEANRSVDAVRGMGHLVTRAIAEVMALIAAGASINLREVGEVLVVGNTAMLSLLSGVNHDLLLQPENWTRRIDCQPEESGGFLDAWGIARDATIRLVTPLGGFIGSDLLAGILSTRLIEQPPGALLIDFGTNSEMALWDGEHLLVTSTAGGPAFEGCGISCGMPGEAGAICHVAQEASDGFSIQVLGNVAPLGLCGSGLVDAVAFLLRNHRLDKVGRFIDRDSEGFVLAEGPHRVVLKRGDIDVLQRAKAAVGGGVRWLCQQAGMKTSQLTQVFACGAFGRLLDVSNAQQIGLLPKVPLSAVKLEGNTALTGCEALLLSKHGEETMQKAIAASQIFNLAEDSDFETLFVESLYLQPMQE